MAAVPPATGLVLSGGGARAAYQAGALCAIAAILGKRRHHPFTVISGTSAGGIAWSRKRFGFTQETRWPSVGFTVPSQRRQT